MPNPFRGIWVALPAAVDAPDLEGCALYSSPPFPAGGETARGSGRSDSLCRFVSLPERSPGNIPVLGPLFSQPSRPGGRSSSGSTWVMSGAPALKLGCRYGVFRSPTKRSKCRRTFWRLSNDPPERFRGCQKAH